MNKKIIDVSKTWKFTEYDLSKQEFYKNLDCNLVVFGEEACPSTGRKHLQGHVSFKRAYRLTALKKLSNAHWEIAKCEDFNYELKGENIFIKDNRKKKGTRTDLERVADMVADGASVREIAKQYPGQYIRYGQGIHRYMGAVIEPRDGTQAPEVTVIYGSTGTGKSKTARQLFQGKNYWLWTPSRGKWFDGYTGQDFAIFEEFRGQISLGEMLTILDRYECPREIKGGMTEFRALNIIITSPKHPKEWYKCISNDKIDQLLRRITSIIFSDEECNL